MISCYPVVRAAWTAAHRPLRHFVARHGPHLHAKAVRHVVHAAPKPVVTVCRRVGEIASLAAGAGAVVGGATLGNLAAPAAPATPTDAAAASPPFVAPFAGAPSGAFLTGLGQPSSLAAPMTLGLVQGGDPISLASVSGSTPDGTTAEIPGSPILFAINQQTADVPEPSSVLVFGVAAAAALAARRVRARRLAGRISPAFANPGPDAQPG